MKKILAIALSVLLVLAFLTACQATPTPDTPDPPPAAEGQDDAVEEDGGADEPSLAAGVTIRVAHHAADRAGSDHDEALHDGLDAIAEEMGFTLIHEGVAGDELRNKILMDAAANNLPDFWKYWAGGVMAEFARAGNLVDIEEYLALSERVNAEDFLPAAWDAVSFDGVKYGIPFQQGIGVFLANRELFEQFDLDFPTTWEEFIAVGQVFYENGIAPTNIGSMGGNPSHFFFGEIVAQYYDGNELTATLSEHLEFNNDTFRRAAHWIQDLRDNNMFPSDTMANGDWTPSTVLYLEGRAAMGYTFGWMFDLFMTDAPHMIDQSVIIPIPPVPDGDRDTSTFIQGTVNDSWVINSEAWADPGKRAAIVPLMDFVNYDLELMAGQIGWRVPVNQNVLRQIDFEQIENRLLAKVLNHRVQYGVDGSPMIWQNCPDQNTQFVYQAVMDELWAGAIDADEFVDRVQVAFDDYREANR